MLRSASAAVFVSWFASCAAAGLTVFPRMAVLNGPESSQQLLVAKTIEGRRHDFTRLALYETSDPDVAVVSPRGQITPVGEGTASVSVAVDGVVKAVPVEVGGLATPEPVSFRQQIQPVLTKASCNSGGCHGKAEGQNGFKLSVFGFDPDADHAAITQEARGRRINSAAVAQSLLLKKATALTPHGGGMKFQPGQLWYRRVARWIAEGARLDDPDPDRPVQLEITPGAAVLPMRGGLQLQVFAVGRDGQRECITPEAEYFSNDIAVAKVDRNGWVQVSNIPGEAAILVRHMGQVGVSRVTLPQGDRFQRPAENNEIDRLVWDRLTRLGIEPSPVADDSEFLRRVYLDMIGTLPTVDEVRDFLRSTDPHKREQVIDALLNRNEYGDFWAMKWADILRLDREIVKPQGTIAMTRWLRRQFIENRPYNEMVRDIISVRGNTHVESPAAFYTVHKDPEMLGRSVSQVFLGVRIECAQCHHHPFEKWGQQDYYAFSGFFTGIGRKGAPGGGTKIFDQPGNDLAHPRTKMPVAAAGLGADPADLSAEATRRAALADWMTQHDNAFLSRTLVNRIWAHYFGRGLVEPIDDLRATNPPSNPPLMDCLSTTFVRSGYDIKRFTKLLVMSNTYQLTSRPNDSNRLDQQNFSHAAWKSIPAEVLLDAICQVTGVAEQFNGWPAGYRAIEVWDNRMPSYFFRVFGKPQRVSTCECERGNEPSIAQALHLMNSPESVAKIRHRKGTASILATSELSSDQIIERLYLAALSRDPTAPEVRLMQQAFSDEHATRRTATEDVLWTLLNTREFVFNH